MSQKNKVIISGVSSFVGMHLAQGFAEAGWDVTGLISSPLVSYQDTRAKRLKNLKEIISFRLGDLTNSGDIRGIVQDIEPSLWIQHGGFAENYQRADYDLAKSFQVNVLALSPLYQALAEVGAGVIVTGSSMEYSSSEQANLEGEACWPDSPYGLSKLAETLEAKRLSALHKVPTRVARLYIPVGTYDAPGKLMDTVIKKLKASEQVDLSPCTQKRDFLSVEDISAAYLKLADDLPRQQFDLFNICSGEAKELRGLLSDLCGLMEKPKTLLNFDAFPMRPGEPMISYGSNEKAKSVLNWTPAPLKKTLLDLL